MKAFEEKYGTDMYDWGVDDLGDCIAYSARKEAWKAALMWALSQGYRADGQGSLESVIEKELKD